MSNGNTGKHIRISAGNIEKDPLLDKTRLSLYVWRDEMESLIDILAKRPEFTAAIHSFRNFNGNIDTGVSNNFVAMKRLYLNISDHALIEFHRECNNNGVGRLGEVILGKWMREEYITALAFEGVFLPTD